MTSFFLNSPPTKYNSTFHDWENFNKWSFLEDLQKFNRNQVLQLNQDNVNINFENYLKSGDTLINSHALLKKLNKKKRKFPQTPWITKGMIKQSKKNYYNNYFRNNVISIKNTRKGIKSIISLNIKESESPKIVLNIKSELLTKSNDISNQFNNIPLHLLFNLSI